MSGANPSRPLRVVLHGGTWTTNIGNAFLHWGARALIQAAVPDAELHFASTMPHYYYMRRIAPPPPRPLGPMNLAFRAGRTLHRILRPSPGRPASSGRSASDSDPTAYATLLAGDPTIDVLSLADCDLIVVAGMMLSKAAVWLDYPALLRAARGGTRILFLGVGAEYYNDRERKECGDLLARLDPIGLSSRDDDSYDLYGRSARNCIKGIDCGFFVSHAYRPLPLRLKDYVAAAFDTTREPATLGEKDNVVRLHHCSFGQQPGVFFAGERTMISELPQDYLAFYANAREVHSDRVHACVAALSYGVPARFYGRTPRVSLFKPVGCDRISDTTVTIREGLLDQKKAELVTWLRRTLIEVFPGRVGRSTLSRGSRREDEAGI